MINLPFPVGYHDFHKKQVFNYQMNRWYSFGYIRYEDLLNIGARIHSFSDWRREMKNLAERAAAEGRFMHAAFFYRATEFYTFGERGEKETLYDKFIDCFYGALKDEKIYKINIPYKSGFLPAIKVPAETEKLGTILLHGGFDSFLEEWYLMMKYLSRKGYEVIGFEGPGQGAALSKYGLVFDIEWEKPVQAVLDYFKLDDVTIFGLSMGGWLCLRAAAFEQRIQRVIANGHAIDYLKCLPPVASGIHKWIINNRSWYGWLNKAGMKKAKAENTQAWITNQLMYITDNSDKPMDATEVWLGMNAENMRPERITQDVLMLSGKNDHFVPVKRHKKQIKALVNARSVSDRVFTKKDHAQNHCQVGNIGLMLDTVVEWLEDFPIKSRSF